MVPFDECYTLDGSLSSSFGVWCCKNSLSLTRFEWLKCCHTPGQGEIWIFWIFTFHWARHISGVHSLQQLQVFALSGNEEIISFTGNKRSSSSTPELNCKSSPSSVLLKGGEETAGSVKQMGFPTSWLAPTPGSAQQAEKQLRHNSTQLVLGAMLHPQETNSTWLSLSICGSESLHSFG